MTSDEAIRIIEKMDINKDGSIEWSEFLQAIYEWLESIGALKDSVFGEEANPVNVLQMIFKFNSFRKEKCFI